MSSEESPRLPHTLEGERELTSKLVKIITAFAKITEGTDRRAYALLSGIPPPKGLVIARAKLQTMIELARSKKLKDTIAILKDSLDKLLDYFQKTPVFIETMMSGEGGEEEREVII